VSVYLNGEFMPLEQACVPVLDRGFIFGDGVYEVVPAYGGHMFRLPEHLARLARSLEALRIPNPHDAAGWQDVLGRLVAENDGGDLSVYLQVTRGVAKRDHAFPADIRPTVFAMTNPLMPLSDDILQNGIATVTLQDYRWGRCDIKAITLLPNVLMRQQAVEAGAMEAILLRDGHATEGSASNLFVVHEGTLITPPKSPQLLPGITRDLVLELARANGFDVREAEIPEATLRGAEEVWMTSSTKEVVPVTRLDDAEVGTGRPGPQWARMYALYQDYKAGLREGHDPHA
jgi:D-alanine transaminase